MVDTNSIDFYQAHFTLIEKLHQVDQTHCIHHGYYEKGIRTHIQSVINMNDFIGHLLKLDSENKQYKKILDAGCGIGGTVVYFAKKFPDIKFTGINIVPDHIEMAKKLAKKEKVLSNTEFFIKDFEDTDISSNQFDAIYLMESACYALQKQILIREMYRILKPGGIIVITDVFRILDELNPFLTNIYKSFCKGWGLSDLIDIEDFIFYLKKEGFHNIVNKKITKHVTRTILRGDVLSIPYIVSMVSKKIFLGKKYQMMKDSQFPGISPVLTTILGIKKAITYNAITAMKK
jgi:ubiquinone/menaquinone biosynthesis C-methylase UbiE